mmetsp:Transcript_20791/g.66914  ORF Transcript_20791/g.66914 Transcript_20791/m.66914 type:complete len:738 (-) Transcript_20791:243-2456(-)|eukprot:CAMPEP_0118904266 /NCGR_PEP_ID=MMETSP1166-20130328/8804_1 /TAXON_ID=1104430 /ORGANISM="Chrysoreinhardia sp, Strain CCMP3193" /LENGTH=737 /DNA_ID=CAMNT_0006843521 /DNA_START=98 /DNA_END=2311 /DNA_ORIENTATION=-
MIILPSAFLFLLVLVDDVAGRVAQEREQQLQQHQQQQRDDAMVQVRDDFSSLLASGELCPKAAAALAALLLEVKVGRNVEWLGDVLMNSAALRYASADGCDNGKVLERALSIGTHVAVAQRYAYLQEQRDDPLLAAGVLSQAIANKLHHFGPHVAAAALCAPHACSKAEVSERYRRLLFRLDITIATIRRQYVRRVDAAHLVTAMPIAWPYLGYAVAPLNMRLFELFLLTTQLFDRPLAHLSIRTQKGAISQHRIANSNKDTRNFSVTNATDTRKLRILVVAELGQNTSPGVLFEEVFIGLCRQRQEEYDVVFAVPPHLNSRFAIRARRFAAKTILLATSSARHARNALFDSKADVILYLALGLSTLTYATAQARLAPVQLVLGHGHPISPGLPATIDYFISSIDFEGDSGINDTEQDVENEQHVLSTRFRGVDNHEFEHRQVQTALHADKAAMSTAGYEKLDAPSSFVASHNCNRSVGASSIGPCGNGAQVYAEQLVLFDSRTIGMVRLESPARLSRADIFRHYWDIQNSGEFDVSAPILTCLQHSKKLHPDFDDALAATLEFAPQASVVFLQGAKKHLPRWRRSIGEEVDRRFVFIDRSSHDAILAIVASADAALDTYPWGGGVTVLEALAVCTPIVVLPNRTSVLHLAKGHLQVADLDNMLLAKTPRDFGEIAARLTRDSAFRIAARNRACARTVRVFDPQYAIDEWSSYLSRVFSQTVRRRRRDYGSATHLPF